MTKFVAKAKAPFPKVNIKTSDIDLKKIEGVLRGKMLSAIQKATERTATEVSGWLDEAFDAELYDWPRDTERSNGSTVGSPRNIVDLGTLKKSKKVKTRYGKTFGELSIEYNARYASYVYYGAYIYPYGQKDRSRVYTPGRPWVSYALTGATDPSNTDVGKYIRALRRNLDLAAE
jgi:hypothetical protein